jgi:hypothetical protein
VRIEAINRLTMSKGVVTARRTSSSSDFYSWVWVIPLSDSRFRVRVIEVPRHLVDEDIDFYDGDMTIVGDDFVDSVDDIDEVVRCSGVDPEDLEAPWHNGFPL